MCAEQKFGFLRSGEVGEVSVREIAGMTARRLADGLQARLPILANIGGRDWREEAAAVEEEGVRCDSGQF